MASHQDNIVLPVDLKQAASEEIIQMHINRFIEQSKMPQYPRAGEINDFFPLVHKILIARQNAEGIQQDKQVLFVEEDPPDLLNTETITFYLQTRVPGSITQGPAGSGGHREVRHHLRAEENHPDFPGEKMLTFGKFYDNVVKFNIYARTNNQARQRLLWFTQAMDLYQWYFFMNGFRVIEEGVGQRERPEVGGLKITKYPVSFYVRTEDTRRLGTQELKQVAFTVDVATQL